MTGNREISFTITRPTRSIGTRAFATMKHYACRPNFHATRINSSPLPVGLSEIRRAHTCAHFYAKIDNCFIAWQINPRKTGQQSRSLQ